MKPILASRWDFIPQTHWIFCFSAKKSSCFVNWQRGLNNKNVYSKHLHKGFHPQVMKCLLLLQITMFAANCLILFDHHKIYMEKIQVLKATRTRKPPEISEFSLTWPDLFSHRFPRHRQFCHDIHRQQKLLEKIEAESKVFWQRYSPPEKVTVFRPWKFHGWKMNVLLLFFFLFRGHVNFRGWCRWVISWKLKFWMNFFKLVT